jgi:GNAT superfamily N-acetyltransferase
VDVNGVDIRRVRYDAMVAQALVAAAMADLGERYGGDGDGSPVSPTDFAPPHGEFLVAYLEDQPVGCGGWRSYSDRGTVAELKRMYTAPAARGYGVARKVLAAVEDSARAHGRTRLILECGDRQPEAIMLYKSAGYERIEDFGHYRDAPGVVSLGRDL